MAWKGSAVQIRYGPQGRISAIPQRVEVFNLKLLRPARSEPKHFDTMSTMKSTLLNAFLTILFYFSPTATLVVYTIAATRESEYENNPLTIKDPGHRRIRFYDFLVLLASYAIAIFIFSLNVDFSNPASWPTSDGDVLALILFPQITGGWITFLLWTAHITLLRFYDAKRSGVIRGVNEHRGVW